VQQNDAVAELFRLGERAAVDAGVTQHGERTGFRGGDGPAQEVVNGIDVPVQVQG
jgi:hypothetical protein